MVKKLVLYDKIYNIPSEKKKQELTEKYLKYLKEITKGFHNTHITIKKLREFDNRFDLIISGPEETFIVNLLKKEVGSIFEFNEIQLNKTYKGTMIDVGKVGFGIFVDCAIVNPKTDVLINLHSLRDQLCKGRIKSLKEIIQAYDFIDNFPIFIKVISKDVEKRQIIAEIDKITLNLYKKILDEDLEAVFVNGETKGQVKKAIIKKGHLRDIVSIERFGFLESLIIFKKGTSAPGIIAEIGNSLKNCKMSAIRPERIRKMLQN